MTARRAALAAALAALWPLAALGTAAPHDSSQTANTQQITCTSCHVLHFATGSTLTNTVGNVNVCASCHTTSSFGFPYNTSDEATSGGSGIHHHWDSAAASGAAASDHQAQLPTNSGMLLRINGNGGKLECSTCHDQHTGAAAYGPGAAGSGVPHATQHVSAPTLGGVATTKLAVSTVDAAAAPKGYRVKLISTNTFIISNDGGISWWCYTGAANNFGGWASGCSSPGQSTSGTPGLNDGPTATPYVKVTFSGAASGDIIDFYVSYPFPRMNNDMSAMCENCHVARVMTAAGVESGADGTKLFSHPVGNSLISGKAYDRTNGSAPFGNILDADGHPQTTGDGNLSNNIRLASDNSVRCMSCHFPHATDSNSLSQNPR